MANPDHREFDTKLGNTAKKFKRRKPAKEPPFVEKTAGWGGLPGKAGPNRSAGVKKARTHPKSEGL